MAESAAISLRYKDKVTIVTGGGRGIGKGIVEVFVKHGSKVVIAELQETLGTEAEQQVNAAGPGEALFVKCDVTSEDDVKNMVNQTVAKFGKIDCVINNAGTATLEALEAPGSIDTFRRLFELNVIGNAIVSKYALPHLRKVKGNIIVISSMVGQTGQESALAYSTTKAAQCGFTKTLAMDEAVNGVRVNAVAPSNIKTELYDDFLDWFKFDEARKYYLEQINHLGRIGTTHEVGMACLYLAADATFCTGTVLNVSGGSELGYGVKHGLRDILVLKDK